MTVSCPPNMILVLLRTVSYYDILGILGPILTLTFTLTFTLMFSPITCTLSFVHVFTLRLMKYARSHTI